MSSLSYFASAQKRQLLSNPRPFYQDIDGRRDGLRQAFTLAAISGGVPMIATLISCMVPTGLSRHKMLNFAPSTRQLKSRSISRAATGTAPDRSIAWITDSLSNATSYLTFPPRILIASRCENLGVCTESKPRIRVQVQGDQDDVFRSRV